MLSNEINYEAFCEIVCEGNNFTSYDLIDIHNIIIRKFINMIGTDIIDRLIDHNFSIFSIYGIIIKMIKMKKYAKAAIFINRYGHFLLSSFVAQIITQNLIDKSPIIWKYISKYTSILLPSDMYHILHNSNLYGGNNYMAIIKKLPIEKIGSLCNLLWVPQDALSYFLQFKDKFVNISKSLEFCTFDKVKFIYKNLRIQLPEKIIKKYPKLQLLYWHIQLIRKLRLIRQIKTTKRYISFLDGLKNIFNITNINTIITSDFKHFRILTKVNYEYL